MNIGTEVLEKLCARHIIAARVEQGVVVDRPLVAKGEQAPAADRRRPRDVHKRVRLGRLVRSGRAPERKGRPTHPGRPSTPDGACPEMDGSRRLHA